MPALDSELYFIAPAIQQSFIDKDSGELLAGGKVYFYLDSNHNVEKDVYYLTGLYGSYTLTAFPNPIVLSSIGTVVDPGGNPKEIYYHPFDDEGNAENYYIEVYSSDDTFQFSISNFPGIGYGESSTNEANSNYISNGQFRLHNNVLATDTHPEGFIPVGSPDPDTDTLIAPGGHHFITDATGGQRYVTFYREASSTGDAFPRYYAHFVQEGSGLNGTYVNYSFRVKNASTFSNNGPYTLVFTAYTDQGNATLNAYYYQYFGNGGSSSTRVYPSQVNITSAETRYSVVFSSFPSTSGKTIGPNDDDYFEVGLQFPITSAFDIYLTDVLFLKGSEASATYPMTTSQEDAWRAIAGGLVYENYDLDPTSDDFGDITGETYDGSLIGLPLYLSKQGVKADTTVIGEVKALSYEVADFSDTPYLFANGQKLETAEQSSVGIPYARLWKKYWNNTIKAPIYGTGSDYVIATLPNNDEYLLLTNNSYGSVGIVNATAPFTTPVVVHTGSATSYNIRCYASTTTTNLFYIEHKNALNPLSTALANAAKATLPVAVNFSIVRSSIPQSSSGGASADGYQLDYPRGLYSFEMTDASTLAGATGKYFTFSSSNGASPTSTITAYYVWYKITTEADPAPGGTAILVQLEATDTAAIVAQKTIAALQGGQVTLIECPAASAITGTPYVTFEGAGSVSYYFWINKNNTGTDPSVGGTPIEVAINDDDTNVEVAAAIRLAINKKFYALPDLRGATLRGFNDGAGIDLEAALRYSIIPGYGGDAVGTWQQDQIIKHTHRIDQNDSYTAGATPAYNKNAGTTESVSPGGGQESRSYNISVQYVIRY